MLSVLDIVKYLNTIDNTIPPNRFTYNPNKFLDDSTDDTAYIRLYGGSAPSKWTTKIQPSFQIVLRSKHPQAAEKKAMGLYTHFHQRKNFHIRDIEISSCFADQSAPLYIGTDKNNRFLYSINFTITMI